MSGRIVPPSLALGLIGAARASNTTQRDVQVVLGRLDVAFSASSSLALPHGSDFAVLLALIGRASDTGVIQMSVADVLRAANLGTGGRQHANLLDRLRRLEHAEYHVRCAPTKALMPTGAFRLFRALTVAEGELRATLTPEFAEQVRVSRDVPSPLRLPDAVPVKSLALLAILELIRSAEKGQPDDVTVSMPALVALLDLRGRWGNVQRTVLGLIGALRDCGHLTQHQVTGRGQAAHLTVRFAGPDAALVAMLTARGFRAADAKGLVRKAGVGILPGVALADRYFKEADDRGKPYNRRARTRILADMIHHPEKHGLASASDTVVGLPVAASATRPAMLTAPVAADPSAPEPQGAVSIDSKAIPFLIKVHAHPQEANRFLKGVADQSPDAMAMFEEVRAALAARDTERIRMIVHAYAAEQGASERVPA